MVCINTCMNDINVIRSKLAEKGAYNVSNKQLITDWLAHDCKEQFQFGLTLMPKKVFSGYVKGKKYDRHLYKQELEAASNGFVHKLNGLVYKKAYARYNKKLAVVMTIEGERSYKDLHAHFALSKPSAMNYMEFGKLVREAIERSGDFCTSDPNFKLDSSRFNEQYRYKLDITDDGWLYYITKELDKHNLHNLFLP